jgi:hypothetical protein
VSASDDFARKTAEFACGHSAPFYPGERVTMNLSELTSLLEIAHRVGAKSTEVSNEPWLHFEVKEMGHPKADPKAYVSIWPTWESMLEASKQFAAKSGRTLAIKRIR